MAAATVTEMPFGYSVTGGTDATTIKAGLMRVKALAFSASADDATAALTSTPGSGAVISSYKFKANLNDLDSATEHVWFGETGVPFKDLAVTLSTTTSHLYVFVC